MRYTKSGKIDRRGRPRKYDSDGSELVTQIGAYVSESLRCYLYKRAAFFGTTVSTEIRTIIEQKRQQDEANGITY